jgi:hypothetical protein
MLCGMLIKIVTAIVRSFRRESFIGLVLGNCARVVYVLAGEFEG